MRIKILHVIYTFDIGGLENGLVNLINYLPEKQFSHVVCVLSKGKKCAERVKKKAIYYELGKEDGNNFLIPFKIASIIRKEKIDIVHTRNWASLVEGVLGGLLGGCRTLIHSEHGKEISDTLKQPVRRIIAKRICFRLVKNIITVSNFLKAELVNNSLCASFKVKSIINGVDTRKFAFISEEERIKFRKKYKIPESAFVIGSIGRLSKIKNYMQMVLLCNDLQCNNSFFIIAGDGPERESIEHEIKKFGLGNRFKLLGEQHFINEVLSTFDLFINTSHYEGVSNTILEAMSKGIPVIAHSAGGTPEIVQNCSTGYLIQENKQEDYICAIKRLKKDEKLRRTMSEMSRRYVKQNFSLDKMVREYKDVYLSAV
ncbi:glycosyltransferase [Candidatus Parcubacteria bacterium]|nr:glycosyltransferase [Candidatus Parcubacteria bacterium]